MVVAAVVGCWLLVIDRWQWLCRTTLLLLFHSGAVETGARVAVSHPPKCWRPTLRRAEVLGEPLHICSDGSPCGVGGSIYFLYSTLLKWPSQDSFFLTSQSRRPRQRAFCVEWWSRRHRLSRNSPLFHFLEHRATTPTTLYPQSFRNRPCLPRLKLSERLLASEESP
jgi:hypothetical protein